MPDASSLRRNVERSFDGDLAAWVEAKRALGLGWRVVSADLLRDYELNVSHETLRVWYGQAEPAGRAAS